MEKDTKSKLDNLENTYPEPPSKEEQKFQTEDQPKDTKEEDITSSDSTETKEEGIAQMAEEVDPEENIDVLTDEYFQNKDLLITLRDDIKEAQEKHPEFENLNKLNEQTRAIRKRMKVDEELENLNEKASAIRDRQKLLKEVIAFKLVEKGEEEIVRGNKKLKVTPNLKEMKNEESLDFGE
ncbi:hypothetical protein JW887_03945 [Candidatus Dojkabacteria bacterium]|nr:hypothetical protein [Candidatus Dojkabacteria bacterium]